MKKSVVKPFYFLKRAGLVKKCRKVVNFCMLINYFLLVFTVLLMIACSENFPEPDQPAERMGGSSLTDQVLAEKKGQDASRSFTGRDSVGIAFKARVSGIFFTPEEDECKKMILEGSGKATHLAHIRVERSHCITEDFRITDGEFTYIGFKGDKIFGTYKGTRGPTRRDGSFTFEVKEEMTGGTGRFAGVEGKATVTGIYYPDDDQFSYTSDGWLLNTNANRQNN